MVLYRRLYLFLSTQAVRLDGGGDGCGGGSGSGGGSDGGTISVDDEWQGPGIGQSFIIHAFSAIKKMHVGTIDGQTQTERQKDKSSHRDAWTSDVLLALTETRWRLPIHGMKKCVLTPTFLVACTPLFKTLRRFVGSSVRWLYLF